MNKLSLLLLMSSITTMDIAVSSARHYNRQEHSDTLEAETSEGPKSGNGEEFVNPGRFTESLNRSNKTEEYTDWTPWSRCMNCFQRRMKLCISDSCQGSRMYEERPCRKKRCKRKSRQKESFHVVHLNEVSNLKEALIMITIRSRSVQHMNRR
ncbi:unnamed protein product [Acanthoscelides obtectus]|uniref:Uncharacterized protein n=1 Tax=Acanthoscelides obtectus TaxID=200917 RepID=A0A9P0PVP1_ACAOB|nr:unnamed protein product [Acanthoscelides obtectus]CAK1651401.1 hypothetical protein AOBTE_LOCUS17247 [Acanthoscelides obtectus]